MDVPDDMSSSDDESLSSEETPSHSSTSDPSSSQNLQKNESPKVSLSHNETKAVNRSKILVYVALVFCAITIGTSTYFIARGAEVQNFEDAVRVTSNERSIEQLRIADLTADDHFCYPV